MDQSQRENETIDLTLDGDDFGLTGVLAAGGGDWRRQLPTLPTTGSVDEVIVIDDTDDADQHQQDATTQHDATPHAPSSPVEIEDDDVVFVGEKRSMNDLNRIVNYPSKRFRQQQRTGDAVNSLRAGDATSSVILVNNTNTISNNQVMSNNNQVVPTFNPQQQHQQQQQPTLNLNLSTVNQPVTTGINSTTGLPVSSLNAWKDILSAYPYLIPTTTTTLTPTSNTSSGSFAPTTYHEMDDGVIVLDDDDILFSQPLVQQPVLQQQVHRFPTQLPQTAGQPLAQPIAMVQQRQHHTQSQHVLPQIPQIPPQRQLYGMIKARVNLSVPYSVIQQLLAPGRDYLVNLQYQTIPPKNNELVAVLDPVPGGQRLGSLDHKNEKFMLMIFKGIFKGVSYSSMLMPYGTGPTIINLGILLFGPSTLLIQIRQALEKLNIALHPAPSEYVKQFAKSFGIPPAQTHSSSAAMLPNVLSRELPSSLSSHSPYASSSISSRQAIVTPEQTVKSQIEAIFASITEVADLPHHEPDPHITSKLYDHQKQALWWMLEREKTFNLENGDKHPLWQKVENGYWCPLIGTGSRDPPRLCRGGIVADDMGLGKTLQVLSLIVTADASILNIPRSPPVVNDAGNVSSHGTLIVCPLSTVSNWESQIEQHVARNHLSVYIYHGSNRTMNILELAKFDIVITTYNILAMEYSRYIKKPIELLDDENSDDGVLMKEGEEGLCQRIQWRRIVLDEAHIIKEPSTLQARACCAVPAERRCGTPIQNRLEDLYSLCKFLRVDPFADKPTFKFFILSPLKSRDQVGVTRLQTLMKSLTLRRTKNQDINGKPLLSLPKKVDEIRYLELGPEERKLYDVVANMAKEMYSKLKSRGKGSLLKNFVFLLETILRLRQIATHPALCKSIRFGELNEDEAAEEAADTSTPQTPQTQTRRRLTAENARQVLQVLRDSNEVTCGICNTDIDEDEERVAIVSVCRHLFCDRCVPESVANGNTTTPPHRFFDCPDCGTRLNTVVDFIPLPKDGVFSENSNDDQGDFGSHSIGHHVSSSTLDPTPHVEDDASSFVDLLRRFNASVSSTKVQAIVEDLQQIHSQNLIGLLNDNADGPVKTVIFSQWTSMLSILETHIVNLGIRTCRLDGTMSRIARTKALDDFQNNDEVTVMLISIKAGGVGLNLTRASRIYIVELNWNPSAENQAIDRVHRLGQTREVTTIRYIVRNTIEENILRLQHRKLELAAITFREESPSRANTDSINHMFSGGKLKRKERGLLNLQDRERRRDERLTELEYLFTGGGQTNANQQNDITLLY